MPNKYLMKCKNCNTEIDVSEQDNPESIVEIVSCENCDKSLRS